MSPFLIHQHKNNRWSRWNREEGKCRLKAVLHPHYPLLLNTVCFKNVTILSALLPVSPLILLFQWHFLSVLWDFLKLFKICRKQQLGEDNRRGSQHHSPRAAQQRSVISPTFLPWKLQSRETQRPGLSARQGHAAVAVILRPSVPSSVG